MTRSLPQSIQLLLTLAVLVVLIAAQQLFSLPGGSALWRAVQDSLHAPWFFTVVVVLFWWFRDRSLPAQLLLVGGIAVAVALGTEFAQSYVDGRSSSRGDLVRNLVGGALGFVFAAALLRRAKTPPLFRSGAQLGLMRIGTALLAVVALAAFTVWQPWQELELRRYRDGLLPQVVDFTDERAKRFVAVNEGGLMKFGEASAAWPAFEGRQVVRLTFGDSDYPTFYIHEVMQKWATFAELSVDVFVLEEQPLPLTVAVQYEGDDGTSAFVESVLPAGANQLRIPRSKFLPDEAIALRIRDVLIYTSADSAGRSVLLGSVELL